MTTWADFLAEVRLDVQDTGATPRWTDEMLWIYTKDAIRDYSQWFPKRVDRLLVAPVDGVYALPADYVDDVYVECPEDRILERRQEIPGRRYGSITRPLYYHIQGGNLYLNGSPLDGDNLYLTYDAVHPVPASETDKTFPTWVLDQPAATLYPRIVGKSLVLTAYNFPLNSNWYVKVNGQKIGKIKVQKKAAWTTTYKLPPGASMVCLKNQMTDFAYCQKVIR